LLVLSVQQFFVGMPLPRRTGTKSMNHANDDDDETDPDQEEDVALNQEEEEDLPAWRSFRPLTAAHPEAASAAVANLESFLGHEDDDEKRKINASRTPQYRRTSVQPRTEASRRLFGVVSTVESDDDEDDPFHDSRPHWTTGKATTGTSIDPRGQQQFLYNSKPIVFTPPPRIKLVDSFDPYASTALRGEEEPRQSLLDVSAESSASSMMNNEDDDDMMMMMTQQQRITPIKNTLLVPGSAGYLELEEDPSSSSCRGDDDFEDPIRTESGLLLTHRRPVAMNSNQSYRSNRLRHETTATTTATTQQRGPMDIEPAYYSGDKRNYLLPTTARRIITTGGNNSHFFHPPFHSVLRYAKLSVACSALILLFGTSVLWHHTPSAAASAGSVESKQQIIEKYTDLVSLGGVDGGGEVIQLIPLSPEEDTIVLLPLPENITGQKPRRRLQGNELVGIGFQQDSPKPSETLLHRHMLNELRSQFQHWMVQHDKQYHSESETAHRFSIWQHNRHRTATKNARHGPCLMTGKTVFGDNHLQDLSTDEFRTLYLNGAGRREPMERGSADDDRHRSTAVLEPRRRLLMFNGCKWFDVSCNLRYFFSTYLYGLGGTMASKKVDPAFLSSANKWLTNGCCVVC
jgi:Cathepsin propeptide inhibitor domain (I29)